MDITRFRSFAERYVIERASTFKGETEMEDAWSAVERAKTIYKHIERVAIVEDDKDRAILAKQNQGNATQAPPTGPIGATGMHGPKMPYAPQTLGQKIRAIASGAKTP